MIDPSPAIASLQARWHSLLDPDRALAIHPIIRSGVSQRKLAGYLNCSPSLIRRLLRCLQADPDDLELARHCQISTNELEDRAAKAKARRDASHKLAIELKLAAKAVGGTRAILRWLASDKAAAGNAEQIVQEARTMLMWAEQTGGLPTDTAPIEKKLQEIIHDTRPNGRTADQMDVSWFANWLAKWSFYAYPDRTVLWGALDGTLSKVSHRSWMANL
jgi:hypothetical protein